jgi:hypothetical protein
MLIIDRNQISDEKQDSILQIEKRFRSGGLGKSEIGYIDLYPNRWDLVNQIEKSARW